MFVSILFSDVLKFVFKCTNDIGSLFLQLKLISKLALFLLLNDEDEGNSLGSKELLSVH